MKPLTDEELLERLLTSEYIERLPKNAQTAFMDWEGRSRPLTEPMRKWIRGVAERLGIQTAPSENIFSAMDPEKQARQRAAALKIRLPWEK